MKFCQKAIAAPSIDKMDKQPLLKQIDAKLYQKIYWQALIVPKYVSISSQFVTNSIVHGRLVHNEFVATKSCSLRF